MSIYKIHSGILYLGSDTDSVDFRLFVDAELCWTENLSWHRHPIFELEMEAR